jgi:hypothetical protein
LTATNDPAHIPATINSPSHGDKYAKICNILQAGATALETTDISDPEETPKNIISLINLISQKLTTINPLQDIKTIKKHLDTLSQKIESLTKALAPPDVDYKIINPQPYKNPSQSTTATTKRQHPNTQNNITLAISRSSLTPLLVKKT